MSLRSLDDDSGSVDEMVSELLSVGGESSLNDLGLRLSLLDPLDVPLAEFVGNHIVGLSIRGKRKEGNKSARVGNSKIETRQNSPP